MNILVVSGFWPTQSNTISGIFVVQQVAALARAGCQVTVVLPKTFGRPSSPHRSLSDLGLDAEAVTLIEVLLLRLPEKLSSLPGALWLNTKIAGATLARVIKQRMARGPDSYAGCVAHGGRYMGLALPAWRRHVGGGASLVLHGVDPFLTNVSNGRRAKALFNAAGRTCDAVVLVGSPLHEHAVSIGLPADKLHVVANGTDLPDLAGVSDSQRRRDETRRIVSVSNLVALKGIDDNLHALADIAQRRADLNWEYRIIGDGIERQRLEAMTLHLGIADKVRFVGRIPYGETMREIADADIFTLPSWGEAFGIVYLEAMARMRPVVGCLENGAADIITHDSDGLLVPPRSVADLSRALERLIVNPDLCRQLGRHGRTTAEGYSWDHNARRMLELLGIKAGGLQ
jgi:glycosyltransferase involved in cell wall biosynthesis